MPRLKVKPITTYGYNAIDFDADAFASKYYEKDTLIKKGVIIGGVFLAVFIHITGLLANIFGFFLLLGYFFTIYFSWELMKTGLTLNHKLPFIHVL